MAKWKLVFKGTNGPDFIPGTPFDDTIRGLGGNDTLGSLWGGGVDRIYGGKGDDVLIDDRQGGYFDLLDGGPGNDTLYITTGVLDQYRGGSGNDTFIHSGLPNLLSDIDGGSGHDTLILPVPFGLAGIRGGGSSWQIHFPLNDMRLHNVEEVQFLDATWHLDGRKSSPVAVPDAFTCSEEGVRAIDIATLLANDRDPDRDTCVFDSFAADDPVTGNPTIGSVFFNGDAGLVYDARGRFDALAPGESALDRFTYTITDNNGGSATATVTMTIEGANDAPVANRDEITVTENGINAQIFALENDDDPDAGDRITLEDASVISGKGVVQVYPEHGLVAYWLLGFYDNLAAGEQATATLEYTITDTHDASATGEILVTILGENDRPVAEDDDFATLANAGFEGNLLADNSHGADHDPDAGDALRVSVVHGRVVADGGGIVFALDGGGLVEVLSTGRVRFNPLHHYDDLSAGETATETFNYTIRDTAGATDTATVTITIDGINDAPSAQPDLFTTDQGFGFEGNLFANNGFGPDTDPDGPFTVSRVNGAAILVGRTFDLPGGGLVEIQSDGRIRFNPVDHYNDLGPGETETETLTYTISDDQGATDTAAITIAINGLNDAPRAVDDAFDMSADAPTTALDVLANDSDPDVGDTIIVSDVNTSATRGVVEWTPFSVTYRPGPYFEDLPAGAVEFDRFDYTVSDGNGGASTASVEIRVSGVNHRPSALPDTATTTEEWAVTVFVLDNDVDIDGDPLAVSGAAVLSGGGSVTHDGVAVTYTPDPSHNALPEGAAAPVVVAYAVDDGRGGTATGLVNIDVLGLNDRPIAVNDSAFTTEEDIVTIPVLGNDRDPDTGDTLRVTDAVVVDGEDRVWFDDTNVFFDPVESHDHLKHGEMDRVVLAYLVEDDFGASASAFVTLEIGGLNDRPEASGDLIHLDEDAAAVLDLSSLVHDVDGDDLEIALAGAPIHGSLAIDGLTATYVPDPDYHGEDHFNYFAWDGWQVSDTAQVTLRVHPVPDAPVAVDDAFMVTEDAPAVLDPLANDSDADDDPLTIRIVDPPVHGTLGAIGATVTYTPNPNYFGPDAFSYEAWDGGLASAVAAVALTVVPKDDPPVAVDDVFTVLEDSATEVDPLANDSDGDGDPLTIRIVDPPAHGTLSAVGETVTYTPDPDYFGPDGFTYEAWDGVLASPPAAVVLTVELVPDPPIARDDDFSMLLYTEVFGASVFEDNGHGADTDPDGAFTVIAVGGSAAAVGNPVTLPGGAVVRVDADGGFHASAESGYGDLSCGEFAEETFTYTIADADGLESTATVTLVIEGNPPLIAVEDFGETTEGVPVTLFVAENDGWCRDFRVASITQPVAGTVSRLSDDPATGGYNILVFDPEDAFDHLGAGESKWADFSYTLEPLGLGTPHDQLSAPVHVLVHGADDVAVARDDAIELPLPDDSSGLLYAANVFVDNGFGADEDPDGPPVVRSVDGDPAGVGVPLTLPSGAQFRLDSNGDLSFTGNGAYDDLPCSETATETFTYGIGDGPEETATVTLTILGYDAENPPLVVNDIETGTDEDTPAIFGPLDLGPDIAVEPWLCFDIWLVRVEPGPDMRGWLVTNPDGSITYDPTRDSDGNLTYPFDYLDDGESEWEVFERVLADERGQEASGLVYVEVRGITDVPVSGPDGAAVATDGTIDGGMSWEAGETFWL